MTGYLGLGSNEGDRLANLSAARAALAQHGIEVTGDSSVYETAPQGEVTDQPDFLNACLRIETELEPVALMRELLRVEREMGRERAGTVPKGPRVIDLDLLLYTNGDGDDVVMGTEELTLPHPEMQERRFVLEPLAEIAPEWVHPVLGLTVRELAKPRG